MTGTHYQTIISYPPIETYGGKYIHYVCYALASKYSHLAMVVGTGKPQTEMIFADKPSNLDKNTFIKTRNIISNTAVFFSCLESLNEKFKMRY